MGKGGTGKSTVAAALAIAAVRQGKRVLVCEVGGRRRVWDALIGGGPSADPYTETEVMPGLSVVSIDPQSALEEYLRSQLPSRALYEVLRRSRMFQYLVAAAPGARELLTIGKVWETAQLDRPWTQAEARYELVVVDCPATGHGLALLNAPRTFGEIARVGRIRRQAGKIDAFVRDAGRSGVVAVTICEEMPVSETAGLAGSLERELGLGLSLVVANAVLPDRFEDDELERLRAFDHSDLSEAGRAAVGAAVVEGGRARAQRSHLSVLEDALGPAVRLPRLLDQALGLDQLNALADALEPEL